MPPRWQQVLPVVAFFAAYGVYVLRDRCVYVCRVLRRAARRRVCSAVRWIPSIDIRRRLVLLDLTMIATYIHHTASTTTT